MLFKTLRLHTSGSWVPESFRQTWKSQYDFVLTFRLFSSFCTIKRSLITTKILSGKSKNPKRIASFSVVFVHVSLYQQLLLSFCVYLKRLKALLDELSFQCLNKLFVVVNFVFFGVWKFSGLGLSKWLSVLVWNFVDFLR